MNDRLALVFATCRSFGLDRQGRLEWAGLVLNCNVESFKQLNPVDVEKLRDAAIGATWMAMIKTRDRREASRARSEGARVSPVVRQAKEAS